MAKRLAAVLLLAVLAAPVAAHPAARLWPTGSGNHWTYRIEGAGEDREVEMGVVARSGGWALVDGFEGRRWWWTSASTGHVWVWNPWSYRYSLVLDLGAGRGRTFVASIEGATCLDGSTWVVSEDGVRVETPVGSFDHATAIVRTRGACIDSGFTRLVFVPDVGLVEFVRATPRGLETGRLVRATVGGVEYRPLPPPPPGGARIPPRPAGAIGGSEWAARHASLGLVAREEPIVREVVSGNVPGFLRGFQEVHLESRGHTATIRVLPDYLAIGSDADFVRVPVGSRPAQKIADAFGMFLPTRRIVDAIYTQAAVRLAPRPMTPGAQMISVDYFLRHHRTIQGQLAGRPPGDLVAGHKKDVVISKRLETRPDRVAIYGWHTAIGKPIQPLSTIHEHTYADYSHGIRLVDRRVVVDGVERDVAEVLADPELAGLLSDEGTMNPRVPGVE